MKTLDAPGAFRATTGTREDCRVGVRIAVSFTDEEFEAVRAFARKIDLPVATVVRRQALARITENAATRCK